MQNVYNSDYFGKAVKAARKHQGLTQSHLAGMLRISTRYIKSIENNGRKPSYDLLVRIIRELNISPDVIINSEIKSPFDRNNSKDGEITVRSV